MDLHSFKNYATLRANCLKMMENPSDISLLKELKSILEESPKSFINGAQQLLISTFLPYMVNVAKNKTRSSKEKLLLVETLNILLDKLVVEHKNLFFNCYTFLLLELYDYSEHMVLPVTEEYKMAVLKCMISLINSVSSEIIVQLYAKENIPKFSQIIYVCSELAKNETARNIRTTAITCIMAIAQVLNTDDPCDTVLRSHCADVFMFFLPGLSTTFPQIALEDLKVGHAIPMISIRAFGRIISLVMQDYNPPGQTSDIKEVLKKVLKRTSLKGKLEGKMEIDQYLDSTIRNTEWYKRTDIKLNLSLKKMGNLTFHSHINVRLEMANMASSIVKNCLTTMPQSVCTVIEHLIILSQDPEPEVATRSHDAILELSRRLSADNFSAVFESLEDGFYNALNSLPRKFNGIDDAEKVATLNLLIGYIKLFGEHNLSNVLLSSSTLHNLVEGLLHIIELEKSSVSLLEEYTLKDLSSETTFQSPWINFHYFKDEAIKTRIDVLCEELVKSNCFEVIYDSLFSVCFYDSNRKKEAIYLINSHISAMEENKEQHMSILKNVLNTYTGDSLNDLKASLDPEEFSLEQIQDNVILICLLTEGIGKTSLVLKENFRIFLLKSLYLVLEKAGSGHPLIRAAGLLTLQMITCSCGYSDVTDLINSNFDFFSYHVQKKLIRMEDKEGVLNVLSVVLQYSNVDVLLPMRNIIQEVLLISCDRFKEKYATAYLKVFKMFIVSLRRWFKIEVTTDQVKTRKEKEMEHENFKVAGIDYSDDFSDDIMQGKTAEELYKEDIAKKTTETEKQCDEDDQGYEKPPLPMHVELASLILKRSLHFLPSKSQSSRLLALDILERGIEILREWEDELLPVVHQIWSPLIHRFNEDSDPLTIRFSVRMVTTLARLSKDFIRMRVVRELLPKFKVILSKSAQTSYLKDKGSAYRYSQGYKMQCELLACLGPILYHLDVEEQVIRDMIDHVYCYLSDKQPQELQAAVVDFIKMMFLFDAEAVKAKLITIPTKDGDYSKNLERINKVMEEVKE